MTTAPWIAFDTSGDQASVALGEGGQVRWEVIVRGARRHAVELLPATEKVMEGAAIRLDDVGGILVSDGPGSFTGLRIGATVAKALAHARGIPVRTASALLVIARRGWKEHGKAARVLAVSDALRGEVYAALYDMSEPAISTVREPTVVRPEALGQWGADLMVSALALPLPEAIHRVSGEAAQPRAAVLLDLLAIDGATREILDLETWEPDYGRPAEAQVRWEATHGRRLPDSAGTAR